MCGPTQKQRRARSGARAEPEGRHVAPHRPSRCTELSGSLTALIHARAAATHVARPVLRLPGRLEPGSKARVDSTSGEPVLTSPMALQ